jgi:hypothetical protein
MWFCEDTTGTWRKNQLDQKRPGHDSEGIRDRLAMRPRDRMTFTLLADGTVLMRLKSRKLLQLAGIVRRKGSRPILLERLSR